VGDPEAGGVRVVVLGENRGGGGEQAPALVLGDEGRAEAVAAAGQPVGDEGAGTRPLAA
jgi:hypothetical protein